MKRAALILARGFEESEALTIADVLIRAGLTCELTGLEEEIVEGAHGIQVKCDRVLGEDLTDYDMIILPGGYGGVDAMSGNEVLIRILQEMDKKGRFVCAICAAPAVLEKAGLLEGRRYTAYAGYENKIAQGTYVKQQVVEDGSLITGMGPAMAYLFGYHLAAALGGDAETVKSKMLYNHSFKEVE